MYVFKIFDLSFFFLIKFRIYQIFFKFKINIDLSLKWWDNYICAEFRLSQYEIYYQNKTSNINLSFIFLKKKSVWSGLANDLQLLNIQSSFGIRGRLVSTTACEYEGTIVLWFFLFINLNTSEKTAKGFFSARVYTRSVQSLQIFNVNSIDKLPQLMRKVLFNKHL